MTIEDIEGIDANDLQKLRSIAGSLHEETLGLLATPLAPRDYEASMRLRNAMIIKLKEASGKLKGQIVDLEAVVRDNGILMSWLRSDKERLESEMISGFVREKEDRMKQFSKSQQ